MNVVIFYLVQAYLTELFETMVFFFLRDAREGGVNAIKIQQTWLMGSCNLCHLKLKLLKQEDLIHMKGSVVRPVLCIHMHIETLLLFEVGFKGCNIYLLMHVACKCLHDCIFMQFLNVNLFVIV